MPAMALEEFFTLYHGFCHSRTIFENFKKGPAPTHFSALTLHQFWVFLFAAQNCEHAFQQFNTNTLKKMTEIE